MTSLLRAASLTLVMSGVLVGATGCSGKSTSDSGSSPTSTRSSVATSTSSAATASQASPVSTPASVKTSGSANVGVVIDQGWQLIPAQLSVVDAKHLEVRGALDEQGQFSAVNPGTKVTAQNLSTQANVVWLSSTNVLRVDHWNSCGSRCTPELAPSDAQYVVVQKKTADSRIDLSQATVFQLQMTKVNSAVNNMANRAASTLPPR